MIQKEVLHNLGILNARLELFIIIYFLVRRVGWRKAVTMFPKRCGFFHLTEFYLFYKEINFFLSFLDKVLTLEFESSKNLAAVKCGYVQIVETQNKNFIWE